jgi:hypothetical protein
MSGVAVVEALIMSLCCFRRTSVRACDYTMKDANAKAARPFLLLPRLKGTQSFDDPARFSVE